jgi:DNA repair exonuclease SbcCD nuclease subunit
MRIVHFSDIHLSNDNLEDLRNFYIGSLINDLQAQSQEKRIDLVLITGDLLDKGGKSFTGKNAYQVFEEEFIDPIASALQISKSSFLFIPGNHDIDQALIEKKSEYYLTHNLTKEYGNSLLADMKDKFIDENQRMKPFKDFEKKYHANTPQYEFSNNESLFVVDSPEGRVGIALINDSWRCSAELKPENHFIGFNQLFNAKRYFEQAKTTVNIALFHHPLESLNQLERDEIENILRSYPFHLAIFGHLHLHKQKSIITSSGGYNQLSGRAAFNNTSEKEARHQPGYNIIDLSLDTSRRSYEISPRKFIRDNGYRFDFDVDSAPGGKIPGLFDVKKYYELTEKQPGLGIELPSGYSADVDQIVKLLIGKSLYPNPLTFVRELIQNAVDACNRQKDRHSLIHPSIIVSINTQEGYFEVSDEGDGMTKRIVKEQFAIIGKSISQEYNEATHNFNLISQFGIGFISTFIAAEKIYVATKNESDDLISFQIEDVFRGFTYQNSTADFDHPIGNNGTVVRVYVKRNFNAIQLFEQTKFYCRHIENLKIYLNGIIQNFPESWNLEQGIYFYNNDTDRYKLKLAIGKVFKNVISSNSGFFLNQLSLPIMPFRFPFLIFGEINFLPRTIDFDISRTNIIESEKSASIRKEISVALRILFRQVMESGDKNFKLLILPYLQFYLCHLDSMRKQFSDSYGDFYSKNELVKMCMELMESKFENKSSSLEDIFRTLSEKGLNIIYTQQNTDEDDVEDIMAKFLIFSGQLVVVVPNIQVQFRDVQLGFSLLDVYKNICEARGFRILPIGASSATIMDSMRVKREEVPEKIATQIRRIEGGHNVLIDFFSLSSIDKPLIRSDRKYLINFAHPGFQLLVEKSTNLSDENIYMYLLGLFGLLLN